MSREKNWFILVTASLIALLILISGCGKVGMEAANLKAVETSSADLQDGKLGIDLPLNVFIDRFNQAADLKISGVQQLKADMFFTSFLYTFNKDQAISFIVDDSTGVLISVTLVTLPGEEGEAHMKDVMTAADPSLTGQEQAEIIHALYRDEKPEDGSDVEKHDLIFHLKTVLNHIKFSAST